MGRGGRSGSGGWACGTLADPAPGGVPDRRGGGAHRRGTRQVATRGKGVQPAPSRLEHHPTRPVRRPDPAGLGGQPDTVASVGTRPPHVPHLRQQQSGQHLDGRGLPGTIPPDQRRHLAATHPDADIPQRGRARPQGRWRTRSPGSLPGRTGARSSATRAFTPHPARPWSPRRLLGKGGEIDPEDLAYSSPYPTRCASRT